MKYYSFITLDSKNIIFVAQKCGYSSIASLAKNGLCAQHKFCYNEDASKKKIYVIRSPYKRLESFYKDKMIKNINDLNQNCQISLLDYFTKGELLNKRVSFRRFVTDCIGKGYSDPHISPLYDREPRPVSTDIIYDIDKDINQIRSIFGAITFPHKNSTRQIDCEIVWLPEMLTTISILYRNDFLLFRSLLKTF